MGSDLLPEALDASLNMCGTVKTMGCPTENHHFWMMLGFRVFEDTQVSDWCIIRCIINVYYHIASMCWNMFMDVYGSIPIFHWTSKKILHAGSSDVLYSHELFITPMKIVHSSPLWEMSTLGFLDVYGTSFKGSPGFSKQKKPLEFPWISP